MNDVFATTSTKQLERTIDSANNYIQAQTVMTWVFIVLIVLGAIAGAGKAAANNQAAKNGSKKQNTPAQSPQNKKIGAAILIFLILLMLTIFIFVAYCIFYAL